MSKPVEGQPPAADGWAGLLENYRRSAVLVLASHLCDGDGTQCSSCGQQWPCRAACAAELALEL
jgi:hypothetical protein